MIEKVAIAYIPVLHKGYLNFLNELKKRGITELWLVGDSVLESHEELDYINRKDRLRAIPVTIMQKTLQNIMSFNVFILEIESVNLVKAEVIYTPREDISECVVANYFSGKQVEFFDVFLRWNKNNVGQDKQPSAEVISLNDFQKDVCGDMLTEAGKSFDWWRQVGAALIQDGKVVCVTHNEHMPEEQIPNINGDTRALFKKGIHINYVTSAHAEVVAIASAAKNRIATDGAELFVTDFPCPYCARLIAKAGIKKLYYMKGYAVLDGDDFLKGEGVKLFRISL